MGSSSFIQDLAVVLLAAGFVAMLCHRLNQPKMLGYILVGLFLGPHTIPSVSFIRDEAVIRTLADLGVIFLMVSVGLDFNLRKFRRVGAQAGIGAVLDCGIMLGLGFMVGRQLGWSTMESLFLGGIVCDSSTTILARSMQDFGYSRDKFAGYVIGVTVVEDVIAVAVMAVLTGLAVTGAFSAGLLAGSLWLMLLFLSSVIVVGLLTLPRLLDYFNGVESDELLLVSLVGICFGVALLASHLGLSMVLGAVLVGAIASESRAVQRSRDLIAPLKHVFGAVFFVAIGLMLDPAMLMKHWGPVLLITGVVVLGKFITNTVAALLTGHDMPTAIKAGASLAQIGEFAFIIAALGISLGVTGNSVYQIGVSVAILTIIVNPYHMSAADRLAKAVDRSPLCRKWTVCFNLYGEWAQRIRNRQQNDIIRNAIRRSLLIIVVNTMLIFSAIACAGYLARQPKVLIPALSAYPGMVTALFWLSAMILCLPLYIATIRKLGAVGMILAEMGFPAHLNTAWARHMRSFVSSAILTAGSFGLLALTFILSSAILQSLEVILLLMLVIFVIGVWHRPRMVKIYSQAQLALESVFTADEHKNHKHVAPVPDADAFMGMNVNGVTLHSRSSLVGLSLREAALRTKTGVTIVGIQRGHNRIMNPGSDEVFADADRIFMLGTPQQVSNAIELVAEPVRTSSAKNTNA